MPRAVKTVVDRVQDVVDQIIGLTHKRVLIGIPSTSDGRKDGGKAGNALIGYVMEHGSPKHNVPARPHLVPGVKAVHQQTINNMMKAARSALDGDDQAVDRQLTIAATRAVSSVKKIIRGKIPPPLAAATVRARLMRTKAGARRLIKMSDSTDTQIQAWGAQNLTPLIDTGDYIKHITWVIRNRGTGKTIKGGETP